MEHFAGLDVSVNETSVCIVDETGKIVREVKVASRAADMNRPYHFKRFEWEPGPLSQWLYSALAEAEFLAVCIETRRMQAVNCCVGANVPMGAIGRLGLQSARCANHRSGRV